MKILHHGWQQQKFAKQIQQRKKNLTAIFKRTMGIYTHTDDVVSRDKHRICDWALLPLRITLTQEKHALTGCHRCLLAHDFAQFGGYQ